jgi:hypothetical protein
MVYPALLPLMRTPRLPIVDWTDTHADVNGLVRFAERRNLVSAHVPSHFKRSQQKANFPLEQAMKGQTENSDIVLLLNGGWWKTPFPGRFTPVVKNQYVFYWRQNRPQGHYGQVRKISASLGFESRTLQPDVQFLFRFSMPTHLILKQVVIIANTVF